MATTTRKKPVMTLYVEVAPWGDYVLSYDESKWTKEGNIPFGEPQEIEQLSQRNYSKKEAIARAEKLAAINSESGDYEYVVVHFDGSEVATFKGGKKHVLRSATKRAAKGRATGSAGFAPFSSWAEVLAHTGPLYYMAPMERMPLRVEVVRRFKNGGLRVRHGQVSFTADAGHLDRFFAKSAAGHSGGWLGSRDGTTSGWIRPGDRVKFIDARGAMRSGRVVMRSSLPGSWVVKVSGRDTPEVVAESDLFGKKGDPMTGRAGGRMTYRKGYDQGFPQRVREALHEEIPTEYGHGYRQWSSDYSKLAKIAGIKLSSVKTIPKDLHGEFTAPNGLRIKILRATGALAKHRVFAWCDQCAEWVPVGRVAQHSGGKKHLGPPAGHASSASREHLYHTFAKLPVGAEFHFKDSRNYTSIAQGPWIKTGTRKYRHASGGPEHTVGKVSVRIEYPANR